MSLSCWHDWFNSRLTPVHRANGNGKIWRRPKKGYTLNHGHIRLTTGPFRWWYFHQVVVDQLIREWNPFGWTGLQDGWQVHHLDFDRRHNAPYNLLLLSPELHSALTCDGQCRNGDGSYHPGRYGGWNPPRTPRKPDKLDPALTALTPEECPWLPDPDQETGV